MARPNVTFLWNNTANDGANSGNASGGAGANSSNWVVMDLVNDKICFLDAQQMDGDLVSGNKYPVIIPASGSIESPKTFIMDTSVGLYDQVPLAGTNAGGQSGGNFRYVFAVYFDGPTAGIPYLEAWDDNTHTTIVSPFLGTGTPSNSTLRGVTTTNGLPGSSSWAGTPLAGGNSRLALDAAALTGAKGLYFNIKQVISSAMVPASSTGIVLTLRYLYS